MINRNKKGQVNSMAPAIIALLIAGFFLVTGIIMLNEIRDTDILTQSTLTKVVNESGYLNHTGYYLARTENGANSYTILIISNGSTAHSLLNVTQDGRYVSNSTAFNFPQLNFTYTFLQGDEAYRTGNSTMSGIASFSDYWPLIVLAVIITIIIGLIVAAFGKNVR